MFKEATVGFPLRINARKRRQVLMGKRMALFHNGLWNGPGGKLTPFERRRKDLRGGLRREVRQEFDIHIDKDSLCHVASLDFLHTRASVIKLEWRVHFFIIHQWTGEPRPLKEFSELAWFPVDELPFHEMVADRILWLPAALNGNGLSKLITGQICHDADEMVKEVSLRFEERR